MTLEDPVSETAQDLQPDSRTPWEQVVSALELQGRALRSGRGAELEVTNLELERICDSLTPSESGPLERALVVRARSLARENALLLMGARDQVARALSLFQAQARTGLA